MRHLDKACLHLQEIWFWRCIAGIDGPIDVALHPTCARAAACLRTLLVFGALKFSGLPSLEKPGRQGSQRGD